MGYFPRVYTSPTLVATPFPRFLGSGAWQGFFGIRARFANKTDQVHACDLKRVIITLQYTYRIHTMMLSPLGNWLSSLWKSISLTFRSLIAPLLLEWSEFHLDSYSSLDSIFPDLIFWNRLSHSEAGSRDQSAQRNRGVPARRRGSLFVSVLVLDSFIIPCFIWISRTKFL